MSRVRLLQVCNVGKIVGGTAACAWTITRSLPDVEHHVAFLSPIDAETRRAFGNCECREWQVVDRSQIAKFRPDLLLLHNVCPLRLREMTSVRSLQYVHSRGPRATADHTVYCSRWLAAACGRPDADVLYQAVPTPPLPGRGECRSLRTQPVIGRICTPHRRKWPGGVVGFYERLAGMFQEVRWEFVGCPDGLRPELLKACRGRASFYAANWEARRRLWEWDAMLYHHPTLTESFGRVAAESMRAGCVPIVDARGGFLEQIAPGCGFVCREESDFAVAVRAIMDPLERRKLSRAGMRHADAEYSLARFRRDFLSVLRRLL